MVNLYGLANYKRFRSVGVEDALTWSGPLDQYNELATAARYGMSWAMVHWMFNQHPQAFGTYQAEILKGASPENAWRVAFPNTPPSEADKEIYEYMAHGGYQVFTVPLPASDAVALKPSPLKSAEVHALRAQLDVAAAGARSDKREALVEDAKAELAQALVDDPNNLMALEAAYAAAKPSDRKALAERATQAHPEASDAWMMLGGAMGDSGSPAQQAAYLKAATLSPKDPMPLNALAWARVTHGDAVHALPYAMKAAHLAPLDSAVLDTLAASFAGVGRCEDAVKTESRALDFLPERSSVATVREYRERLKEMQTGCKPAAPAPSPAEAAPAAPASSESTPAPDAPASSEQTTAPGSPASSEQKTAPATSASARAPGSAESSTAH
jgi:hypothetical protein